jgi:two-component SAPR family response regulator
MARPGCVPGGRRRDVIAILIEVILQELGCHVVGPVSRLDAAMRLAHEEPLDAAILDVRSGVLEILAQAGSALR